MEAAFDYSLFSLTHEEIHLVDKILDIQHRFNPLHVYCRLIDRGWSKTQCMSICKHYEILIYSWFGWLTRFAVQICRLVGGRGHGA